MAFEAQQPLVDGTRKAGADLRTKQYYFVKLDSSGDAVVCAAATDVPYGVLQNTPNTGEAADICIIGITKVSADAALAINDIIGTSGDGQADAKAWGTDKTEYGVGRVILAADNAGELATAVINCVLPSKLNLTA